MNPQPPPHPLPTEWQRMIDRQLRPRGIDHPRVLDAFSRVDRRAFVLPESVEEAWGDTPLAIGHGQTISQPFIVALMLQTLDPQPTDRILDVGAGSGYQLALLGELVAEVWGIERIAGLAERAERILARRGYDNVHLAVGDGSVGLPAQSPFDGIVCGAAAPEIPPAWIEQLDDDGRIVAPVGRRDVQTLVRIEKRNGRLTRHEVCDVRFVPLIGKDGWEG